VHNCNSNQIKMYDKNGILYCEEPKCHSSCPIDTTATCISTTLENKNDINNNICQCSMGWEGELCNEKTFLNIK